MMVRFFLLAALLALANPAKAGESAFRSGPAGMQVDLLTPDGVAPKGLVLVLHTSGGHQSHDTDYARKLVAEGYAAAVPHFLSAYGITVKQRQRTWSQFRDTLFEDFRRIADEAAARTGTDRNRVFAVGFSNGGYWAAYLAGKGVVSRGVCYYGALTEAGFDRELNNLAGALAATTNPVLILHGSADETVNIGAARRLRQRVAAPHHSFVFYDGAEHRFEREGGEANTRAAGDAWTRTLAFFAQP